MTQATSFLTATQRSDGIFQVEIDMPGEAVNTLRPNSIAEFHDVFDLVEQNASAKGVIFISKKQDNFIAGADISMLGSVSTAVEGTKLSTMGQEACLRIERCRVPVVACIHGACLGGGLEIALACHARIASDSEKTKLGLPEVQLGILPGMGGTVRLVETIGLSTALDLLLTGRQVAARKALTMGLIQACVDSHSLLQVATEWIEKLTSAREKTGNRFKAWLSALDPSSVRESALSDNPLGRKVVFDQAYKELFKKTRGNYPAPERILKVVRHGLEKGEAAGYEAEAKAFGDLVVTSQAQALRHVFFCQQAGKKYEGPILDATEATLAPAEPIQRVGVIGGGLMGQGITCVTLDQAHLPVRVKETSHENVTRFLLQVDSYLKQKVERRKLSKWQRLEHLGRLTATLSDQGLENCDIVIEAVFEDLQLKRDILGSIEARASSSMIFASNTSAIEISAIAQDSRMRDRVIGLHYFSPVQKMPLLEIVVTKSTAPWVVRRAIALGKKQGKTVIVVGDGPGFFTTRILAPYLNEAAHLLMEGVPVESIDRQLVDAGFPVGPFTLLDEIGIDVGHKVGHALHHALGDRMVPPTDLSRLVEAGRLGKKSKRGFYSYATEQRGRRPVDTSFYEELGLPIPQSRADSSSSRLEERSSAAERCLLTMVNEAAHCMADGILASEDDGDVGAIFGLGFPAYLGGPFHFTRQRGAKEIVARLERLQRQHGTRFEPAPYLRSLV